MRLRIIQPSPEDFDSIFRAVVGERISLTTGRVLVTTINESSRQVCGPSTYLATATDVFLEMDGKVHRLFVDVSVDFGSGLRHIWLTDGPALLDVGLAA